MKVFIFKKKYLVVVLIILILIVFFLLKDNSTFALSLSKGEILSASFKDKFASICKSDEKVVYLTFDDGPTSKVTPKILDVLEKENVKATFFVVGKHVKEHPELLNARMRKDILLLIMDIAIIIVCYIKARKVFVMRF